MSHVLKNKNLEIHINFPLENYNFSRFDWTGKIVKVNYRGIPITEMERPSVKDEHNYGKGFYNEFGIDTALGFDEADIGGWFHKIGIGLLKKEDSNYLFSNKYKIRPAKFQYIFDSDKIIMECRSEVINGYAYLLKKEILLLENGFVINYYLKNTGEKDIKTSEYVHNFIAINNELIGKNYILNFPFKLKPELFGEIVNPESKVNLYGNEIRFGGYPNKQFFFSNLSGSNKIEAHWELINLKSQIGVTETGNFQTKKVNLWGWKHVISPELFIKISVHPGESTEWSRTYKFIKT